MSKIIWISLSIALTACTSQELYNNTQQKVELDCRNKVGVEREQCLKTLNIKPYKEYEEERQEIIKR